MRCNQWSPTLSQRRTLAASKCCKNFNASRIIYFHLRYMEVCRMRHQNDYIYLYSPFAIYTGINFSSMHRARCIHTYMVFNTIQSEIHKTEITEWKTNAMCAQTSRQNVMYRMISIAIQATSKWYTVWFSRS